VGDKKRIKNQRPSKAKKETPMKPNNDKLKGTINTAAGKLKEGVGRATGNREMENEGTLQKTKGQAQKLSGAVQDSVKQAKALFGIKSKRT
jgi:uncharacterized protein YjbJ (UPF0337 family)